ALKRRKRRTPFARATPTLNTYLGVRGCLGSWRASFRLFSACIGTMNQIVLLLVLVLEDKPSNRGRGRRRERDVGSWKASFRIGACIGTLNPAVSGSAGVLAGEEQTGNSPAGMPVLPSSWKALFRVFSACIGTMNQMVLLLVLEDKPSNRGRERRRERDDSSWKVAGGGSPDVARGHRLSASGPQPATRDVQPT